jgi:hypothetical protein
MSLEDKNLTLSPVEESEFGEYWQDILDLIQKQDTIGVSQLQRKYSIGYNTAFKILKKLELCKLITTPDTSGLRHTCQQKTQNPNLDI